MLLERAQSQETAINDRPEVLYFEVLYNSLNDHVSFWNSYFGSIAENDPEIEYEKFLSTHYWRLFTHMYFHPGLKNHDLKIFLSQVVGVSESTALRMIKGAEVDGLIFGFDGVEYKNTFGRNRKRTGRKYYYLSEELFAHCDEYFSRIMVPISAFMRKNGSSLGHGEA